jgi:hypothetical protein
MARLGSLVFSFAVVTVFVAGCSGNADDLAATKGSKKPKPGGTAARRSFLASPSARAPRPK